MSEFLSVVRERRDKWFAGLAAVAVILTLAACVDQSIRPVRSDSGVRLGLVYDADAPKTGVLAPCDGKLLYNLSELIDIEIPADDVEKRFYSWLGDEDYGVIHYNQGGSRGFFYIIRDGALLSVTHSARRGGFDDFAYDPDRREVYFKYLGMLGSLSEIIALNIETLAYRRLTDRISGFSAPFVLPDDTFVYAETAFVLRELNYYREDPERYLRPLHWTASREYTMFHLKAERDGETYILVEGKDGERSFLPQSEAVFAEPDRFGTFNIPVEVWEKERRHTDAGAEREPPPFPVWADVTRPGVELVRIDFPNTYFHDGVWRIVGSTEIDGERPIYQLAVRREKTMLTIRSIEDAEQSVITLNDLQNKLKPPLLTEEMRRKTLDADHYCITNTSYGYEEYFLKP